MQVCNAYMCWLSVQADCKIWKVFLENGVFFWETRLLVAYLKEKVTPESLLFSLHLWQVNIQLFHSLKYLLSWRNSTWKIDFRGCHFETVLSARPSLCDVWLEIGSQEENLQLTLHPSQGQQNPFFFQAIFHFTIFNAIFSEFAACLAQNNMVQEQP